jgi:tetratricopeptide (TPR) repeat protein
VRALQLVIALSTAGVATATAQLAAPQQPTQRLLVLPFQAASADSIGSIALADAVRDRVTALAKTKVQVIPKAKLCEALKASGFPCDGLLDDQQAKQLARFLQVNAYTTGMYAKSGANLTADVHLVDISSSGMAGSFVATNGNPGTVAALAESIGQKLAGIIRASEPIRDCNDDRKKGLFPKARSDAQKALAMDPNSVGAHLCLATVYEAQRLPDSVLVESQRALKGDSCNGTAWENIARIYQQRGDTVQMVDAFIHQLCGEPRNTSRRLGIAQLLRQMKQPVKAIQVLDEGLKYTPGDTQLLDLKLAICTEAGNFACSARVFYEKAQHDSTLVADTTFIKPAIGAAEQASDTVVLDYFTAAAVKHYPGNASFLKARAASYQMRSKPDSALVMLVAALKIDPNDVGTSLQIAQAMVDRAVWDTAAANRIKGDTAALNRMRAAFAPRLDSAKPYLRPGLASTDSTQRLAASVIMLTAGSKLAQQAQAYAYAYPWLDTLLTIVAPKSPGDTLGPKQQVRVNGSFWYGLSSVLTLQGPYKAMTEAKGAARCPAARAVFDRLTRTKNALLLGRRVHPPTADQMLGFVAQYEKAKPQVQKAFKCSPPLS